MAQRTSGASGPHRNRRVWLFNCADTFSGNPKWLFLYVQRFRPEIEAWWISHSQTCVAEVRRLGYRAATFDDARASGLQSRAGVWVVNQVKEEIPPEMAGITLLNLWHGVGVKSIERGMNEGYLKSRIAAKYIRNNEAYHNTQLFVVTSPTMEKHFVKQIGLAEERVIRAGYPQNVYPRVHGPEATFDHDLRARRGLPASTRIAVYAPTPRRTGHATFLSTALPDLPRLIEVLRREGILLVLKMHPHLSDDPAFRGLQQQYGDEPHLMFWDNKEDFYEVIGQVDLAVVDYSSILYDLLAGGVRQVVRYVFDFHDGNDVIEPGVDYLALSVGPVAESFDSLLERLGEDCTVEASELDRMHEVFWAYDSDDSLARIVDAALEFEPTSESLPTLYSFDVFDTLIRRRSVEPRSIFYAVRHHLERNAPDFPSFLVRHFVQIREDAEHNVRQSRAKHPELAATGDLEITLDEIHDRIAAVHQLTTEQRDRIRAWEVSEEIASIVPIPDRIAEVHQLLDAGEEVLLLSDMYLPIDVVRAMLEKGDARIAQLPLYLSNERRAQKSTTRLFLSVYDDRDWIYGSWQHCGDNRKADVRKPRTLGIETRRVPTPRFSPFEERVVEHIDTFDAFLVAGALFRERRIQRPSWTPQQAFAYRNVSLYLTPYLEWVIDHALSEGYQTLYFISRDGHTMRPLADAIIARRGLDLKTRYIYGSRRAWRLASQADGIDDESFSKFGAFAGLTSLDEVAETAALTLDELKTLVPGIDELGRHGRLDPTANAAVRERLEASVAIREHLQRRADEDQVLAVDYLRQEIDFDESHAFVEYWGRGYTQDCLTRLAAMAAGRPIDVPFYYARSIYLSDGHAVRHNFTTTPASMLFIEAIFANLPYGTVQGYRREGDRVVPIVAERSHDEELARALIEELPRFAEDLAGLDLQDRDRTLRDLFQFAFADVEGRSDEMIYVDHIAHLRDAVRLGDTEREFAPALTLRDFLAYIRGEKKLAALTRSYPMSEVRSGGLAKRLFQWGTRHDWRDRVAAAETSLRRRDRRRR